MKSTKPLFSHLTRVLMILFALTLCGRAMTAMAAPAACTISLPNGLSINFSGNGGSFWVDVKTSEANCPFTVKSNHSWLTLPDGENRTGAGFVEVKVARNLGAPRDGSLNIGGHIYMVHQGANCVATLQRTSQNMDKTGGDFSVGVIIPEFCNWSAQSLASWIKVKGNANFTSSGTATLTVEANPGAPRSGKVNLAGQDFIVNQESTCSFAVSPANQSVPSGGGFYSANVGTTADCGWTAISDNETWVKITNVAGKFGNGPINYTVSPNTGPARTAHITFFDKQIARITITQEAGQPAPSPTLSALSPGFVVAGAESVTITLTGTNFTIGSKARWNGADRATTYVNTTQIKATLPGTDLQTAASHKITVYEGSTDKTSNAQTFLVVNPQASVSAASYKGEDIAPDSIVAAFGVKLANATAVASTVPLPPSLAGTTVRIIDSKNLERRAPLFFVSPGQVNYLMPPDMPMGPATVVITSESGDISVGYVNVALVAPGIFTAAANGAGHPSALALRVKANGQQVYEPIVRYDGEKKNLVGMPIDLTVPGEQVFLVLYGTGMRYHGGLNTVSLKIGGTPVNVTYLGVSGLTGLDQFNAVLPASLIGRGEVDLVLNVGNKVANTVKVTFK